MNILNKLKPNKKQIIVLTFLLLASFMNICFVSHNEFLYSKPIAKITGVKEENSFIDTTDVDGQKTPKEPIKNQIIKAIIMNGKDKGKTVTLHNQTSLSQINDLDLKVGDEVFISTQYSAKNQISSSVITDLKRDMYIDYIINIFILFIIIVGGIKGFRSLFSVLINIAIFTILIELFKKNSPLILLSILASILFIVFSILIVSGKNKKSFSAIIGTLIGTFITMAIAAIVIKLNNWSGIHFEEMDEFLTLPPETVFYIELMIGTLGAIMDIAISMSAATFELYEKNPKIERNDIIKSTKEIGQDIMGTMANTLIFAYLSGSIPTIVLLMRNNILFSNIFNLYMNLEIMRALVGSIGIVVSIPITMYISIYILRKQKMGEN